MFEGSRQKALAEIRISEEARGPDLEAGPDNRIVGQAPVINWPLNFIQLINHSWKDLVK